MSLPRQCDPPPAQQPDMPTTPLHLPTILPPSSLRLGRSPASSSRSNNPFSSSYMSRSDDLDAARSAWAEPVQMAEGIHIPLRPGSSSSASSRPTSSHPATSDTVTDSERSQAEPAPIIPQPQSKLLSLPRELRLAMYDLMHLPPLEDDEWTGAYFCCRQMQSEMRAHLKPHDQVQAVMDMIPKFPDTRAAFLLPRVGRFGLLQSLTFIVPTSTLCYTYGAPRHMPKLLGVLYSLYLSHVRFLVQADRARTPSCGDASSSESGPDLESVKKSLFQLFPYGDLKCLSPGLFHDYVLNGAVNCRRVTWTLDQLSNAEHGRHKRTDLELPSKAGAHPPYTMTIVEDKEECQVERSFYSPTRFRLQCA